MSENEKERLTELSEKAKKLDREDQQYLLGLAEGIAIGKERRSAEAEEEKLA